MNEDNRGRNAPGRDTVADAPRDVRSSYLEVLEPRGAVSNGTGFFQIWTRCWEEEGNIGVAFYLTYDLASGTLSTLQYALDNGFEALHGFDPQLEPEEFLRRLRNRSVQEEQAPTRLSQDVGEVLERHFSGNSELEDIDRDLLQDEEASLREWLEALVAELLGTDQYRYQIRVRRIQTETHRRESEEPDEDEEPRPWEDAEMIPVSFLTSPSRGRDPDEIAPGDRVVQRLNAQDADWLPESLLDDEKQGVSVPISSNVVAIRSDPELPSDFEGRQEEYREVIVELRDDLYGRGFVYEKEKLKLESSRKEQELDSWPAEYLSIAVMGVLVLVVLMMLIFMVG